MWSNNSNIYSSTISKKNQTQINTCVSAEHNIYSSVWFAASCSSEFSLSSIKKQTDSLDQLCSVCSLHETPLSEFTSELLPSRSQTQQALLIQDAAFVQSFSAGSDSAELQCWSCRKGMWPPTEVATGGTAQGGNSQKHLPSHYLLTDTSLQWKEATKIYLVIFRSAVQKSAQLRLI